MKIIDAHHHIWRQHDLPWLLGPTQPRIFGEYDSIKRDYMVEEFIADVKSTGVEKSVYVQANWAPNWYADEVAWVQDEANRTGWPHGIVGYCDMLQKDARRDLDKLSKYPLMRSIRQQLHWHENPQYRFAKSPDLARNEALQQNISYLGDYDWSFDLQVFSSQMDGAAELAAACPKVNFVLQHSGMLEDLSDEGSAYWREKISKLAKKKNVYCKLSGYGTFIHKNDPAHIARLIGESVAIFGEKRCLFGSNFPIEKLWTTYRSLINAFVEGASAMAPAKQKMIFHDTAAALYRL